MGTEYKVGQRVQLTAPMTNPNSTLMPIEDGMPAGLKGTIVHVNFEGHEELHQISVKWDNGRSLAILPYVDQFIIIHSPLDHFGLCPKCNADWNAGDIFDTLRPQEWCQDKSDDELRKYIEESYSPPYKFSRLVGVELPHTHPAHYDGVSLWQCPDCKHEWPRFK